MKLALFKLMILIIASEMQNPLSLAFLGSAAHELLANQTVTATTTAAESRASKNNLTTLATSAAVALRADLSDEYLTPKPKTLTKDSALSSSKTGKQLAADPQQAQAASIPIHHQPAHPANHRNFPIEPYTSASYTSLITSNPNSPLLSTAQFNQNQLNSLLFREHYQSNPIINSLQQQQWQFGDFGSGSAALNSFEQQLQAATTGNSDAEAFQESYNYGSASNNLLNAGLIQNLTDSLFPVKQLSNATLYSLSELLNKTRLQQRQQDLGTHSHLTNGFKTTYYPGAHPYQLETARQQQQPLVPTPNNYLESTLNELYGSLLDYSQPHDLGARNMLRQLAQAPAPIFQSVAQASRSSGHHGWKNHNSAEYHNEDSNPYSALRTSSNVRNSYTPYKDNSNDLSSLSSVATDEQALNMALYNSYLDSGYKLPLVANNVKDYKPTLTSQQQQQPYNAANNNQQLSAASQYQYIQQHNLNNQNHLDKIVYHSTPFRPSIVSPPLFVSGGSNNGLAAANLPGSSVSSSGRQKGESANENKSLSSFGSLSSPSSSIISDNTRPEHYSTNGQAINSQKYSPLSLFKSNQSHYSGNKSLASSPADHKPSQSGSSGHTITNGDEAGTRENGSSERIRNLAKQNSTSDANQRYSSFGNNQSANKSSFSSPLSPAILFDLYEREIDDQIREAIFGEHNHIPEVLLRAPQQSWLVGEKPLYETETSLDQALASWTPKPMATHQLGSDSHHHQTAAYLQALGSTTAATKSRQPLSPSAAAAAAASLQLSLTGDPLASALQELPNFSTADLQPIYPAYSLFSDSISAAMAAASQIDPFAAPAETSSLSPHSFASIGQHGILTSQSADNGDSTSNSKPTNASIGSLWQFGAASNSSPSGTSAGVNSSGLPSFFSKLQTNPLSILVSPFVHLYASLPRYRNNKKATSSQQQQQSPTSQYSQFISPSPLFGHHSLGSAGSKQALLTVLDGSLIDQPQFQQLTPLQMALLRSQATSYLNAVDSVGLATTSSLSGQLPTAQTTATATTGGEGAFGLAGGGISPLIWRSLFSPANWARKQSTSSSGQLAGHNYQAQSDTSNPLQMLMAPSQSTNHQGSHKSNGISNNNQIAQGNRQQTQQQQSLTTSLSSMLSGSLGAQLWGGANSQASATSAAGSQVAGSGLITQGTSKKPRLKIKILRIPVAYYDQPLGGVSASSQLLANFMQPSAATQLQLQSSLSSLSYPQDQQESLQLPHSIEHHLIAGSQQSSVAAKVAATLGAAAIAQQQKQQQSQHQMTTTNQRNLDPQAAKSTTPPAIARTSSESPTISRQGFTDINQPNNLQVSPVSPHGKLFKNQLVT